MLLTAAQVEKKMILLFGKGLSVDRILEIAGNLWEAGVTRYFICRLEAVSTSLGVISVVFTWKGFSCLLVRVRP